MINLVLDFDGIVNNEPVATIDAFRKVFHSIGSKSSPEEAFLFLKYLDEMYGYLNYDEIIKRVFSKFTKADPKYCLSLFEQFFKIKPRWSLIRFLDEYRDVLKVIIFSRNSFKTITKFLNEYSINIYFDKIYAKQKKYLIKSFKNLCRAENLKKSNTLFVGDEIYDVYFPKLMNYKILIFNPLFEERPINEIILEKISKIR